MEKYLKYYWLEQEYLERETRLFFEKEGYLEPTHFFSVIIWKDKFAKRSVKEGFLRSYPGKSAQESVRALTEKICEANTEGEKLEVLLGNEQKGMQRQYGFRLAVASALLTMLYPEKFTVYDYRVRRQLKRRKLWSERPDDITYDRNVVDKYLEKYVSPIREIASKNSLSLRDCDRALWAEDWYHDLAEFISKWDSSVIHTKF